MKRKLICLILTFCITVTALTGAGLMSVMAATSGDCGPRGVNSGKAKWSYNAATTTLTITGTGATRDYGDTALNLRPWDDYKSEITTVIVGEGIETLGYLNFYNFTALTSVKLPSTLKTIKGGNTMALNYGAFRGCTALENITLPDGLTSIDNNAFRECSALKRIVIPDSVTNLGSAAFRDCTSLTSVEFGSGITEISAYAFYNTRISTVEIPENITAIGTLAFANCSFMSNVTVHNANCEFKGIIGEDPFYNSSQSISFYGHSGSTTQAYVEAHPNSGYVFYSIDPCNHDSTHEVITVAPTCLEGGVSTQVCDNCGFVKSETQLPANGHTFILEDTDDQTEANGHIFKAYGCRDCDEEKMEIEHVSFVEGFYTYTNTATCERGGLETKTCNIENCGKRESHIVTAKNHQLENVVVTKEATCTEDGEQQGVCTVCGNTVTQAIPKTGHTNTLVETLNNIADDGHNYEVYSCSVCAEETIKPIHVDWMEQYYTSETIMEPTCVVNGVRRDTCSLCNETRLESIAANGAHDWYETARTQPSCTAVGKINYACHNCDRTKTENIEKLGHDYVLDEEQSQLPTCTADGYEIRKCSRCNMTSRNAVNATGHTPDELSYVIEREPNCTEEGITTALCTVCGERYEMVVSAVGHSYENVLVAIEDKPGHSLSTPTCTVCGFTSTPDTVHNEWIEGYYKTTVVTQGSCVVAQVSIDTCDLCGKERRNTTPAPGHKYSYTGLDDGGRMSYFCSTCENVYTANPTVVKTLWNKTYINTTPDQTLQGYLFELNGDGIINAKDYAILCKLAKG